MEEPLVFREKLKRGFQRFSDGTSMHGFTELYYSNTLFWKIIWLILVGASISLTAYQLRGAVENFIAQPSGTVIEPASYEQYHYPSLKYCIGHWIYWLDWDRVMEYNFTKETVLQAMSYLTNIYSIDYFDGREAEHNFFNIMKENNITSMAEFYKTFSRPFRLIGMAENLTETEFIKNENNTYFCYRISGEDIKQVLAQQATTDVLNLTDSTNVYTLYWWPQTNNIDSTEYNSYMAEWISTRIEQYYLNERDHIGGDYTKVLSDYGKIIPPSILFIGDNGDKNIKLLPEIDQYHVSVKGSAIRWKNKKERKCIEDEITLTSNRTCMLQCYSKAVYCNCKSKGCTFMETYLAGKDTKPQNLRKFKIHFLNQTVHTGLNSTSADAPLQTAANSACNERQVYDECAKEFCVVRGSEEWTYEVTVRATSVNTVVGINLAYRLVSTVKISYPEPGDVLMIMETDSKTWEDFVGTVGGLLGIWTGASIVSVFQLFYLCCCVEMTGDRLRLEILRSKNNTQIVNSAWNEAPDRQNTAVSVIQLENIRREGIKQADKCTNAP